MKIIKKIVFIISIFVATSFASAAPIDATEKYAWGDIMGFVNWNPTGGGPVDVTDSVINGQIWSQHHGWINLQPTNAGVTNTCSGDVGGYAWGDSVGYINMDGVSINPTTGVFSGTATTTSFGTMYFTGSNIGVETDWRCIDAPINITNIVANGNISGTGKIGATVVVTTPSSATCTTTVNASGAWTCLMNQVPLGGELATATQTGTGIATTTDTIIIPSQVTSSGSGGGTRYYCRDKDAINYSSKKGREDNGLCKYALINSNPVDDSDDDGLTSEEEKKLGTNPNNPDTDGDGLNDGEEVNKYKTDPLNPDTDNGGITDGTEVANGTDPLDKDSGDENTVVDITVAKCPHFTQHMRIGDRDGANGQSKQEVGVSSRISEIAKLQTALKKQGYYAGPISGYFGPITKTAVNKWQVAHKKQVLDPWGLNGPTGWFYKSSERWMNELLGCSDSVVLDNGIVLPTGVYTGTSFPTNTPTTPADSADKLKSGILEELIKAITLEIEKILGRSIEL